ncbi:MAG: amidohydrolase family protein [Blastocatellia bacterium]|nr:amidohydrolase family protein [Blastocatellia bacterium]
MSFFRLLIIFIVVFVSVFPFKQTTKAQGSEPPFFAITNARIFTVSGSVIENATVVVADGLISAVGRDVQIPAEAEVIDGKGLTVYPGLIDSLTDLGLQSATPPTPGQSQQQNQQRNISRGPEDRPATTPWQNAADDLNTEDKRIESWREAGFTTVLTAPKTGIFPGQGAVINLLSGERAGQVVVKTPATLQVSFQSAGGFGSFPGSLMGAVSYIKQVFLDIEQYRQASKVYNQTPKGLQRPSYDRTVRAIDGLLSSNTPVLMPATTPTQIRRVQEIQDRFSLKTIIYGGQQGYEIATFLAEKKIPVLVSLKWPEKDRNGDPEAEEPLRSLRFRDKAPSTPAEFEKAGVRFAFYSDGISSPKEIIKNAKRAIDAGLKPETALRAFTLTAAELLGVDSQLGSIEVGKIANLIVTDGDIFAEKTKIKYVFVDGTKYELREQAKPTEPPTVNLTGKWTLTINSPQGQQEATADLKMSPDGTLTGTFTNILGSSTITTGSVSGNKFNFTVDITINSRNIEVKASGVLENNQMKGTFSFGSANAEFTGIKPDKIL